MPETISRIGSVEFVLDPFQREAIEHVTAGENVIVSAPTGAGKTLVAEYAIESCVRKGAQVIYTAPIKALSNQKFRDFTARHGDRIGIMTGDVTINPRATALIMTTEIFRNTIFESPQRLEKVEYVIFDEIHFMDDEERGTVWEESIIFAPQHIRFLCLSATVSNLREYAAWVQKVRRSPVHVVYSDARPVPLEHIMWVQPRGPMTFEKFEELDEATRRNKQFPHDSHRHGNWRRLLIDHVQEAGRLPCLYFLFSRRGCEERAHENVWRDLLSPERRADALALFDSLVARYGVSSAAHVDELRALVGRGIAFHHAGILPMMKEIVERLFTEGFIKLLFATETFALGINMPARSVVFDSLHKFDGVRRAPMKAREYQQMAGRAGRRGMDSRGFVYSGVEWPFMNAREVEAVVRGKVEPISSQFNLSYATLLNLYERLHNDIFRACEDSFANYGAQAVIRGGKRAVQQKPYSRMIDEVRRRLGLLKKLGYISEAGRLTAKGHFAKLISGYELQVSEAYFDGVLDSLDETLLAIVFGAIVFESRRREWYERIDRKYVRHIKSRMLRILSDIQHHERRAGIETPTKDVDFQIARAVYLWMEGASLEELVSCTTASDGDLVRVFRLTIQLLRQVERAIPTGQSESLRSRIISAAAALRRDEVDAEKQLMAGQAGP